MSPSVLTICPTDILLRAGHRHGHRLAPAIRLLGVERRTSSLWCTLSISSGESEFSVGQLTFDSLVLDVRTEVNVVSGMIVSIMRYTRWVPIRQC